MAAPLATEVENPDNGLLLRFGALLRYVAHVDSFQALAVLALLLSSLEWLGTLPGELSSLAPLAARLLWLAYFFQVARKASLGKLRLPVLSDFRDMVEVLIRPTVAIVIATWWFWAVVIGSALCFTDAGDLLQRFQGHPLVYLSQRSPLAA